MVETARVLPDCLHWNRKNHAGQKANLVSLVFLTLLNYQSHPCEYGRNFEASLPESQFLQLALKSEEL